MKGFKFKLDALLKMRRFKEEECKREIGQVQRKINEIEERIFGHKKSIEEAYTSQEKCLRDGMSGQNIRFYPYFIQGNQKSIRALEIEKENLKLDVQKKFKQLSRLRADVKVLEKMKEEKKINYKKELEKKENMQLEEEVGQWLLRIKQTS